MIYVLHVISDPRSCVYVFRHLLNKRHFSLECSGFACLMQKQAYLLGRIAFIGIIKGHK